MALDLEAYHKDIEDERRQDEERAAQEANQAEWEAKPLYSKVATIISEDVGAIADAAGDRLGKIKDAYSAYCEAQAASHDKYGIYLPTPEVQEAGDNLRGAVLEPVTHLIQSVVGGYINQKADEGSTIAQNVRNTETFTHYFMTPEDRLEKAKEIEETTGISADAFINDDVAYKQALNVYDYKRAKVAVMPEDQAMEAVWQEFPELRNVSLTNPNDAALALHDMDSVRQTHGIVETFNHFIALGNKELEYNNLQYKIMTNMADDNDRERAADLERMIAEDKKVAPSFFDDPLSAIVGVMSSSGPEMLQSIREGVRDGLITAEAAALAGAALGTGVEPLGGTLAGGVAGAAGGFVVGTARSVITRATMGQLARAGLGAGMRVGAFEGMRRPETGSRYAEYGNMKDTDGNPLLTDNDRRLYAALGGAANAGIEMANFGIATKPLSRGAVDFLTKGGTDKYAVDAIKGIVDTAKYDVAKRESVAAFAKAQVKDTLKIAATESAEEGAQSIADDLIHNRIVDASGGRAADEAYSIGDIAANALVASVEAIPAGLGFGMASSLSGGSLGSVRHARRLFSEKAKEELAAQKTMTGTVMLNRLQQVASSAKLKETAPDVQQKIIRTQVQGTGFENAYIDTAMAVKKENGLADLKEVAKTAGIREEELQKTIESGGHLFVPAEKYAQSAASPQLLESVSFSPETDSAARMKENAKMLSDALETAQKRAVHARADIVKSIADEYFPQAGENLDEQEKARLSSERDMAKAVIAQNTENPAKGWRSLYNDLTAARSEILQPAIDALSKGMKQGVDILPLGEDGRGIRVSNNAPWYQEYYKEHGKAPNQAQLRDLAYLLTAGDASAPKVEGWLPTTREAAEAMDAARGELDELNGHIQTLENIKERMMKVDSFEVKGSAGLSPEGYKLYRQIMEMLEKIGGKQKEDKQTKVARMNAMLFAYHADIFAAAMRTQEGKEHYTAADYFKKRFDLRYGGKDMRDGFAQSSSARRLKEDMLAWKQKVDDFFAGKLALRNNVMMRSPLVFDLIGADSSLDIAIDSNILQKLVDKHHFTRKDLLQLPKKIADPLFVLRAIDTKTGVEDTQKRIVVVDMEINGATVMIPFVLNTSKGFNKIASAYGRETPSGQPNDAWYIDRLNDKHLLYVHKNRTARWVATRTGAAGSHNAPLTKQSFSKLSIPDETALGKLKKENQGFYQSAWHGTPHDFAEFLLSAIGTGEDAQVHGEISEDDGKRIITLFESADESTFLHEMGHMFLMDLDELAKMDEVSAKELETVNAWAEWHEGAAEEYAETDFADEFRDHENAILAAKKAGDTVAEKAALERWRQERFARGFEMYLSEGKAPSAAMRSVFRRFKAFLRRIYNLAKNAGAMPSAEVQAVMARMIATENEIAEAKLDERFRPIEKLLGKESVESLLGETEAELYKRWTQEAQEEAEDILRKRVINDLKKEAREEFNQKVEAERERKRAELENDPVYLAEYAMRQGGSTDVVMNWFPSYAAYKKARGKRKTLENELKDYMTEYARKLDEQIIQAHLSDENVARAMQTPKAYHRRLAIESAALRRKERLMRLLGGNAPEEVKKKAVADAKKAESQTRRGTKQEVRKEYERSAYEHERFMREEARAYLCERTISESCHPRFFRRNERKYARAMDKAAAAGKWSDVLALKEQQAFAAACAYEAEKNEDRLNKLVEGVKRKLNARTVRLAADERYWLNHIGYLLGLKANDEEKPANCAKLSELFARYKENNDIDACDPSDLLDVITEGKKRYQEMQLDDFADIVNALGILYNVGRRRNEMLTKSMQGKTTDDILGDIVTDDTALKPSGIVEHPVSDDVGGMGYSELLARIPLLGEVVAKAAQEGNIQLTKPELILRLMGDKAHRYIYGTYDRAQMKESELLEEKRAALEKIFSVYSRREKMKWKDRNIDAHGDMLSKENVLCLAMNWGTETNRKRVMDDIGQRFDVMRTLKENMTEKDWKVVQEVWNLLDTFWEESARTEERLNGAHIGKVPASAFTIETADGKEITLKGGYYPLRYNPKKASKVNDKQTEEDVKGRMTGAQVFGTKRSHVKERSEGDVIAPVLLRFDVLKDHIFNASHNIAFRIAARDVYRIINDKKFEAYVSSTYGRPIYDYLKQWAVDVWAVPVEASDSAAMGINRIIGGLRRNSTMAIMGWRMWPCLENMLTNTLLNMDKIGIRKTMSAYFEGLPVIGRGPKALRDMAKKSAFMADRINNMERDIRRDPHIFDPTYKPLELLRDNAYFCIGFTDQLFSVPLWSRVYKEAFPKAMAQINEENEANKRTYQEAQNRVHELRAEIYDLRREMEEIVDPSMQERIRAKEKEFAEAGIALERAGELPIYDEAERIREAEMRAVQAGDAAVRDTFGSGQTKDLAGVQRTRSELLKLFTSFFSFFNTQYNASLEAHYKGKYGKVGYKHIHVWMPLARTILFRMILVGILGGLGKAALGLEGDDDKDKYQNVVDPKTGKTTKVEVPWEDRWMKTVLKNTLSTAAGMFPGIRDFAGFALDRIFDGTTYGRSLEFGSVVSRGLKQAAATWNLIMKKGEDDLKRETEETKERERVKKMTKKQREKYEEEKKYKKPKKEVRYVDIAKSAAQTVSTFTATRHGITNTTSDGLFSIAQFAVDMMETDSYYDPDIRNVLRAAIFDKKLREKEVPKKPEPPKKKQRRTRGRKERTND